MLADRVAALRSDLEAVADPDRAVAMTAYMKDHFRFVGVPTPARRQASKSFRAAGRGCSSVELLDAADRCWAEPEREFQYVATDLLVRWVRSIESPDLNRVERLIRAKSWWDTVDALASNVVGPMVRADPDLVNTMDRWIGDADIWIARTAILHQLKFREHTDAERLFGYIDRRCHETEFFIRKASGWALREYAKTDADAVRRYVVDRGDRLSGLTRREALKHGGG